MVGDKGVLKIWGQERAEAENRRYGETGKGETERLTGRRLRLGERIKSYRDLRVFQKAMDAAMEIFALTKTFPQFTESPFRLIQNCA